MAGGQDDVSARQDRQPVPDPAAPFHNRRPSCAQPGVDGRDRAAPRGGRGSKRTNRLGWHSISDLFARPEPAQARLAKTIKQAAAHATRKLASGASLDQLQLVCDGWINVNPTGAFNAPHDHGGAFWSGVYYVAVPDDEGDGGAIEFIAPQHLSTPGELVKAPMTAGQARFRPAAGTLLIFPATLIHWVYPNTSPDDRVTIAFNASLRQATPGAA